MNISWYFHRAARMGWREAVQRGRDGVAKYRLTKKKTRALAKAFRQSGGRGIEVVCGPQQDSTTAYLARLANELEMEASCGSDFHGPGHPWSRPGGFMPLPADVRPVWESWQTNSR